MANPTLNIKVTAEDKATSVLKGVDGQVEKTGGGMGNLGKAGVAAGAALVAFATKGVLAYEDLGLSVGKLTDSTGLTEDAASRLIEVGGDVGISADQLGTSIGMMEKKLGANATAFDQYGVSVVRAKDGTIDANETFLNAVDALNRIEDPAKRAEAGARMFGKGWQGMSELIGQGADQLRTNLAAVDPEKVFGAGDVDKARGLREAFDSVKDSAENLLLTIGKALAPVITELAGHLAKAVKAAEPLVEVIGEALVSALQIVGPVIDGVATAIGALTEVVGGITSAIGLTTDKNDEFLKGLLGLAGAAKEAGLSAGEFNAAVKDSNGDLDALKDKLQAAGVQIELNRTDLINMGNAYVALKAASREAGLSDEEFRAILVTTRGDLDKTQTAIDDYATAQAAAKEATDNSVESLKAHKQTGGESETAWYDLGAAVLDTTPKVHDATEKQNAFNKSLGEAKGYLGDAKSGFQGTKTTVQEFATALGELNTGELGDAKEGFQQAKTPVDDFRTSMDEAGASTRELDDRYSALIGKLDAEDAWAHAQEAIQNYIDKAGDADAKTGDVEQALRDAERALATYTQNLKDVPAEKKTEILALINNDDLAGAQAILDQLTADRTINISTKISDIGKVGGKAFASGTNSAPAGINRVAENGPEIVEGSGGMLLAMAGGEKVYNAGQTAAMLGSSGGGVTNHITIIMPPGSDGEDVVQAIKKFERRNGPGWRS